MAALPPFPILLARPDDPGLSFTLKSNELGRQSFFPSSEVTSMPTLSLEGSRRLGQHTQAKCTASINEEHYSLGGGLHYTTPKYVSSISVKRLLQREGGIYDKEDKGWHMSMHLTSQVRENIKACLSAVHKKTDSNDKDILELSVEGDVATQYGTFSPHLTLISRAQQCMEGTQLARKQGRKVQLGYKSPLLPVGCHLYASHLRRKWDEERTYQNSEVGVKVPFASGMLTIGAVQVGKDQSELLDRSSLVSWQAAGAQMGLKVEMTASL